MRKERSRSRPVKHAFISAALAFLAFGGAHSSAPAQPASCAPAGGLSFICGVQNPEDLVLVPDTGWLLASGMAPGSGLHLVNAREKMARGLYATGAAASRLDKAKFANCPGPLDPKQAVLHGLSLRKAEAGRFTLYATNHGGRESIEVFELDTRGAAPTATWIGCVLMPDGLAANSVAAFSDGAIVATVLLMPGKTFEDAFAGQPTGAVYLWAPGTPAFRQLPGTEFAANNGIETAPDDREFYVVSSAARKVTVFSRVDTAKPLRVAQFTGFAPDNIRWTSDGRLITAGMIDDEPSCGGPPKNLAGILCSRGYVVATIDPKSMAVTEIARGPANTSFTGASIAMPVGNELWIGSFNSDRLAYRPLK
ncbi:SMP-30/gluconolactonase/LRE family protein [Ramlibacter sp. WS9]|uniref:SMP-30/gluconolactonase/LRE family protein n=1 Tax=Ramlibacter sp. WS9 TaxID=1882741 RepID=UPI0011412831|nr:SMP-30/gluconolactonase/LRE family protein [Ramlibacter sp. WS9]ROZ75030.1 hypothetical protein EEB15_16785 [Ramlibacter sp. WS9]